MDNVRKKTLRNLIFSIAFAVVGLLLSHLIGEKAPPVKILLTAAVYAQAAFPILRKAWLGLCCRDFFNENTLLTIATIGAYIIGEHMEAVSVILQVMYFKITHGKRLFRMAPIHHHFQEKGWSEMQVVQRFWLISLLFAMLGVGLASL